MPQGDSVLALPSMERMIEQVKKTRQINRPPRPDPAIISRIANNTTFEEEVEVKNESEAVEFARKFTEEINKERKEASPLPLPTLPLPPPASIGNENTNVIVSALSFITGAIVSAILHRFMAGKQEGGFTGVSSACKRTVEGMLRHL